MNTRPHESSGILWCYTLLAAEQLPTLRKNFCLLQGQTVRELEVTVDQWTQRNIPEDLDLQQLRYQNVIFRIIAYLITLCQAVMCSLRWNKTQSIWFCTNQPSWCSIMSIYVYSHKQCTPLRIFITWQLVSSQNLGHNEAIIQEGKKVKHSHYRSMGPRRFCEVKAPKFRDIGTWRW
jgi:hypothetical protein